MVDDEDEKEFYRILKTILDPETVGRAVEILLTMKGSVHPSLCFLDSEHSFSYLHSCIISLHLPVGGIISTI